MQGTFRRNQLRYIAQQEQPFNRSSAQAILFQSLALLQTSFMWRKQSKVHTIPFQQTTESQEGLLCAPGTCCLLFTLWVFLLGGQEENPSESKSPSRSSISAHTETADGCGVVSLWETRNFLSWQGDQGLARRRKPVRRTSKSPD